MCKLFVPENGNYPMQVDQNLIVFGFGKPGVIN